MDTTFRSVRPHSDEHAPYYTTYIGRVPTGDILVTLASQQQDTRQLISFLTEVQATFRYASGKWSTKEVIGHIIDAERVFAYRVLRISHNDKTPLAGFDQDEFVKDGKYDQRQISTIADEFVHVRSATLDLLAPLDAEAWDRRGVANAFDVSVRALAWIIAGHAMHHMEIIRSKYLQGK